MSTFRRTTLALDHDWTPTRAEAKPAAEPECKEEAPPRQPEDIEQIREAAREQGRREVIDALRAENESIRAVAEQLATALESIASLRSEALSQASDDVAALVASLAIQIAGESLALNPESLPALLQAAIAELPSTEDLHVLVAPHMVGPLSLHVPDALRSRISADPDIRQGCIVRTRFASLDATLQTAERSINRAIKTWLTERT